MNSQASNASVFREKYSIGSNVRNRHDDTLHETDASVFHKWDNVQAAMPEGRDPGIGDIPPSRRRHGHQHLH